jgi:RNA polymerase sigma-70 factor (ECF subfamily)
MTLTDQDLIQKSLQGDNNAFEELIYRYDKSVLSIALRYVHDSDDAKDIYQEVFIRVFRSLKNFQFKSEFSTWLFRITTNVCLTYISRSKENMKISLSEDDMEEESNNAFTYEGVSPEEETTSKDLGELVNAAVESLSPKQKITFVLKHYEGYKIREIADMLNCKEGTVKKYLFDAVNNLKKKLKPVILYKHKINC